MHMPCKQRRYLNHHKPIKSRPQQMGHPSDLDGGRVPSVSHAFEASQHLRMHSTHGRATWIRGVVWDRPHGWHQNTDRWEGGVSRQVPSQKSEQLPAIAGYNAELLCNRNLNMKAIMSGLVVPDIHSTELSRTHPHEKVDLPW